MPRDEGLRQSDLGDELGDGRFRDGENPEDPQPVDIGEGLVDQPKLAEVVGLEDRIRDRAADVGAGGTQGKVSGGR